MKKLNKKGFTLVELLLVIAIIGILAAVLFVSLGKQRERARMTTFKENMRGLVTAATACHDGGGTVLDTQNSPVCNPASGIGDIPAIPECDGTNPTIATLTASNATGDNWQYDATCLKTTTPNCTAVCNVNGCVFSDCE